MTEPNERKYKQLALFSIIVAEVVITPSLMGGLVYWLLKGKAMQMVATTLAALAGLGIAFFRIYQLYKIQNKGQN
jgi:uncharacterized Tic20 family protein